MKTMKEAIKIAHNKVSNVRPFGRWWSVLTYDSERRAWLPKSYKTYRQARKARLKALIKQTLIALEVDQDVAEWMAETRDTESPIDRDWRDYVKTCLITKLGAKK